MSKLSEDARAAAKSKVSRLVRADPHARIDASDYSPQGYMDGDVQTGPRPVSRRQFRNGGKVAGEATTQRADRKPRASGGPLTANSLLNRNVKSANEDREGIKHDGGMKKGGRIHKTMGGLALPAWNAPVSRKEGGKAHADAAQDRKLIHSMGCKCARCGGGRVGRAEGGRKWIAGAIKHPSSLHKSLGVPEDKNIPAKKLEKAEHSKNPKLAKKANLAETLKGMHKSAGGTLDAGTRPEGGRMPRKSGGRAKKGTNVNIIIAPAQASGAPTPMPMPSPGASPASPLGLRQGVPAAPPSASMPPGAGATAPMMRNRGGRASYPIDAGSGSGLGRLEKAARAARG